MIEVMRFGEIDGQRVDRFRLTSDAGVVVDVLNYGVTVSDWRVPSPEGLRSIVLGFDSLDAYRQQTAFIGSIQGRVANRIGGARFTLDGVEHRLEANEGENILHGGVGVLAGRSGPPSRTALPMPCASPTSRRMARWAFPAR